MEYIWVIILIKVVFISASIIASVRANKRLRFPLEDSYHLGKACLFILCLLFIMRIL